MHSANTEPPTLFTTRSTPLPPVASSTFFPKSGARVCSATSRPSGFSQPELLGRTGGADHLRAERLAGEEGGDADAGRDAGDQEPFAFFKSPCCTSMS